MCYYQQWFELDVYCSALVLNLNSIFSNGNLYRAGQSMNPLPSQILERYAQHRATRTMSNLEEGFIKVLHRFHSDMLGEAVVETLWVSAIDKDKGVYRLENIPFYAKSLAYGDLIEAVYDEDEEAMMLSDILEFSGHSTVQVVTLTESADLERIRATFHNLDCDTERLNSRYFSMDVPSTVAFAQVEEILSKLRQDEVADFSIACWSDKHQAPI